MRAFLRRFLDEPTGVTEFDGVLVGLCATLPVAVSVGEAGVLLAPWAKEGDLARGLTLWREKDAPPHSAVA